MDRVFSSFYGQSVKRVDHKNMEGKKLGSITCHTDRANEANGMFIIVALLIIPGKEQNNLTF